MHVTPIPCFRDNYAYLLSTEGSSEAAVVDASEAEPIQRVLDQKQLRLVAILTTHHHWDHVGGNEELARRFRGVRVFGHRSDLGRVPALTHPLDDGERFEAAGFELIARHVPGHTLGALSYLGGGALFTGDTLFVAGCGRIFEGTARMLYESLTQRLACLPGNTLVYPGHEYTHANLRFAQSIESSNRIVESRLRRFGADEADHVSVPSTLLAEMEHNPFLRCHLPELRAAVERRGYRVDSPEAVFAALRELKDQFR